MRDHLILFSFLLMAPAFSKACDICGCGVGNAYIGILPEFQKKIIGVRYRYNEMRSHLGPGGATTYLTARERYHILEAWGGWTLTDRVRLIATVPYAFDSRENQGMSQSKNGLSDISVSGFYRLFNRQRTAFGSGLLVQTFWLGGGIKLPTGKYNPADEAETGQNTNLFQLGTGRFDFTANLMYDLRYQNAGININTAYKINTRNRHDYQYGNKWNLATQLYYKFGTKGVTITPNIGVQFEKSAADMDEDLEVAASGGQLFMGTIGLESSYKKFTWGANFQAPFSQRLGNGSVQAENRAMLHFGLIL